MAAPDTINDTLAEPASIALDQVHLQAARLWVAVNRPYYAAALFRCPIVATTEVPTLAVDEWWRIYVNPQFANALSVERFAAGLIHEINHVLRDHAARARAVGGVEAAARRWNIAADAEINDDLRADDLDVDGEQWIFPERLHLHDGLPAEVYFAALERRLEMALASDDCGSGADASTHEWELGPEAESVDATGSSARPVSPTEARILRTAVARSVLEFAHSSASAVGSVPGSLLSWAHHHLEAKVDWRRVLGGLIRGQVASASEPDDYSYLRFSRRSAATPGIRLAGMVRHLPQVAVVVDTSGSMTWPMLATAFGEVSGVLKSAGVADDAVRLVTVDTEVSTNARITRMPENLEISHGGTDMRVGITAAAARSPRPDVIIVLTDGYTPWPEQAPRGVRVIAGLIGAPTNLTELTAEVPDWIPCVSIPLTAPDA